MSSDGEGKTPSRALLVDKLRERLRKKDEAEKAAAEAAAAAPPGALGKNGRRDSDLSDASTSQSDSESDKPDYKSLLRERLEKLTLNKKRKLEGMDSSEIHSPSSQSDGEGPDFDILSPSMRDEESRKRREQSTSSYTTTSRMHGSGGSTGWNPDTPRSLFGLYSYGANPMTQSLMMLLSKNGTTQFQTGGEAQTSRSGPFGWLPGFNWNCKDCSLQNCFGGIFAPRGLRNGGSGMVGTPLPPVHGTTISGGSHQSSDVSHTSFSSPTSSKLDATSYPSLHSTPLSSSALSSPTEEKEKKGNCAATAYVSSVLDSWKRTIFPTTSVASPPPQPNSSSQVRPMGNSGMDVSQLEMLARAATNEGKKSS
eukprot:CAMPEP_0113917586 /NCGR_PEP_ID=MMETSP0780_2-20120614/32830_1 /TAXON_ID=652834 /ORGANISM="Palpitomonas bilix" /LENGTH=366 /DNA_ID=CAMNT_0000917203 /DNA_START=62 /DNA_END=1162 /DNA_ORIENTATION=+ /assembly_acc=CAM_ASM_000599